MTVRLGDLTATFDVSSEPWMEKGVCHNRPRLQRLFFPPQGSTTGAYDVARTICAQCPVKAECLDYAYRTKSTEGMFGGLNPSERNTNRRRRNKGLA